MAPTDQAHGLRAMAQLRPSRQAHSGHRTRVIAVSSGKGGVGKTSVAVNLALLLVRARRRVVLLDGDLGLANVDVLLGLTPRFTLHHVVTGVKSLEEIMLNGPWGLQVVPGGLGLQELADLSEEHRQALLRAMADVDGVADILLIDTSAGIGPNVLHLIGAAGEVLVVTTPEPTGLADAYALMKCAIQEYQGLTIYLLVNQAGTRQEAEEAADRLRKVVARFLDVQVHYLGYLPRDPSVAQAVFRRTPLVLAYPDSPAAIHLAEIGRRLWSASQPPQRLGPEGLTPQNASTRGQTLCQTQDRSPGTVW